MNGYKEMPQSTCINIVTLFYIEYNHIKVVIAIMVQKYGQELKPSGELIISPSSEESSNKGALSQLTEDSDWSSQVLQGRCIQYSYDINNRWLIVKVYGV
jgi:hypothetical protein